MEKKNNLIGSAKHYKVKITKKKENPLKFILSIISYAIFIVLLLIGLTLLVYVVNTKIKEARGENPNNTYNAYVVLTESMIPAIPVNDVVITKKVELNELKEGDIITFISTDPRFPGITITHRIKNIFINQATGEYEFETKGDHNNAPDLTHVKGNNILGKVIFKIPKLGYIQQFLATQGGWIIVILIPCLAVLSYDIVKLIKTVGKKKNKKMMIK